MKLQLKHLSYKGAYAFYASPEFFYIKTDVNESGIRFIEGGKEREADAQEAAVIENEYTIKVDGQRETVQEFVKAFCANLTKLVFLPCYLPKYSKSVCTSLESHKITFQLLDKWEIAGWGLSDTITSLIQEKTFKISSGIITPLFTGEEYGLTYKSGYAVFNQGNEYYITRGE